MWCVWIVLSGLAMGGCHHEAAQPDVDRAAEIEARAWERFGGPDAGPNRWDDLVTLLDEIEALREAANAEVDALIEARVSDPWEQDALILRFDMIGSMDRYASEYADPEDFASPDALQDRLALLRDAEAVFLDLLDGLDESGVIGRLQQLRDSGAPFVRPIPEGASLDEVGVFTDQMSDFRRLAQMLGRRMQVAAERGDWDRYVDDLDSVLWLGEITGRQNALINSLVGIAIHALAYGQVSRDMAGKAVDAAVLGRIAESIGRVEPIEFADALPTEKLLIAATNEGFHDERGRPEPEAIKQALFAENWLKPEDERVSFDDLDLDAFPNESEIAEWIEEVWPAIEEHARKPAHVRWRSLSFYEMGDPQLAVTASLPRTIIATYPKADRSHMQIALLRDGLLTYIAVERYRLDRSQLPASLDALVPEYLDRVLPDPLNNNEPLSYRLDDSDLGFVLYSVGFDGADDGGTPAERAYDAFGPDATGVDFIFTHP